MKKTLILSSLFTLTTSMFALDTKYFVGVGAESIGGHYKSTVQTTTETTTETVSHGYNYSDIAAKFKAGVILNSAHRISSSYVKFSDGDDRTSIVLANYDYLIPVPMNNVFRTYFGAHAGRLKIDEKDTDISHFIYGLQAGILYDITKNIEFELGVDYTKYNYNKEFNGRIMGVDFDGRLRIEDSTSIYSGLNYKF